MRLGEISIDKRFCGPPNSGNGGYVCGRLGAFIEGPAVITLRLPPPLETPLSVETADDDKIHLLDGQTLIAEARPSPALAPVSAKFENAPTFQQALEATTRTQDPALHGLPGCFVCGPARSPGDGLCLHSGPVDAADTKWDGPVAAPWVPADTLGSKTGPIAPEFTWSALDCPTAYACYKSGAPRAILLGRMSVEIERNPDVGEHCVILAWQEGEDGRKLTSSAILFGKDAEPIAHSHTTWIEVDEAIMRGANT